MQKQDVIYRYIAILLMFGAFFAQTFSNAVIIGNYYVNTSAYSRHCVNKAKPWMHCNGKCQMRKQIQEEEKKDQENPSRSADNKSDVVLSSKSFFATVNMSSLVVCSNSFIVPLSIGHASDCASAIFHPPQV